MPKLRYPAQPAAQARADAIHNWMQANSAPYADSVAAGQTLRWAIPFQERDAQGNVIDSNWGVIVKQRCRGAMTPQEIIDAGLP